LVVSSCLKNVELSLSAYVEELIEKSAARKRLRSVSGVYNALCKVTHSINSWAYAGLFLKGV